MKATNEQIIAEAKRRWGATPSADMTTIEDFIIEVVLENWTPPEPDLLAYQEWWRSEDGCDNVGQAYLAGARMVREQERERAKVLVECVERYAGPHAAVALAKYRGEW